ncbi:hypothetical protein HanOQP8_Chr05g0200251 [Helianthus annuus]|nr:hypothetical protein HanOQP8_Chr05g0200251 [Helianthus annuus]
MQRWKQSAIDSSESRRRSDSANSELKGASQENIEELQKRVAKAESLLRERDLENTALREQVRQFEARLSEYENKTKVVEEMWQSQMASLQVSFTCFFYSPCVFLKGKTVNMKNVTELLMKLVLDPKYK